MLNSNLARLLAGTIVVAMPLAIASISLAQAPTPPQPAMLAPMVPPAHVVYKTTYNFEPQAGAEKFDDSKWPVIEPKDLAARRSGGHVAFMWYRTPLTIPVKIGDFDTSGAIAVLNVTVDDYAEVWVNGAIPGRSGFPRPATIQGHNVPQRVVLSPSVKSGDKFQIAVFGINGPISMAPANTVWFREAKMEFFK
jgi:gluconolactonase